MFTMLLLATVGVSEGIRISGLARDTSRVKIFAADARDDRDYDTTFVWGSAGQGCYEVCVDHGMTCDPSAFAAVNAGFADLKDAIVEMMTDQVFNNEFADLDEWPASGIIDFCQLDNGKTVGESKSTAAPFRQVSDGKCYATGQANKYKPMRNRFQCHPWYDNQQRFCGCKPSEDHGLVPFHVFQVAHPNTTEAGWRPVTNSTCGNACAAKGLACNAGKQQEIRGVKDMMALDSMMMERGWDSLRWYTPCRTYDTRFFRALNPQHKYGESKCWANPANRNQMPTKETEVAKCKGVRTDKEIVEDGGEDYNTGFRFCYCEEIQQ